MTEIYRLTAHVFIWLGVASQDSPLAIEHLGSLAEHATWNKQMTILQHVFFILERLLTTYCCAMYRMFLHTLENVTGTSLHLVIWDCQIQLRIRSERDSRSRICATILFSIGNYHDGN